MTSSQHSPHQCLTQYKVIMAEKPEDVNQLEEAKTVEENTQIDEEQSFEQNEMENVDAGGKDEVDGLETVTVGRKRKKSGILGRLSTRKKKSGKNSKEETQVSEEQSSSTSDQSANLDDANVEETEEKAFSPEKKDEKTVAENDGQEKAEKGDCVKTEDDKQRDVQEQETDGKRKKPGRLRRLSFSKMKKSKKQEKKEPKAEENKDSETENKDNDEEPAKLEDKNDEEIVDVADVQNVHKTCEEPGTAVQSEERKITVEPVSVDLKDDEEQAKEKEAIDFGKNPNEGDLQRECCQDDPECQGKTTDTSYIMLIASLPSDIAHKAAQRFRQVLRPVVIYIMKKHPNCFKDIIESNKKPSRGPTQL